MDSLDHDLDPDGDLILILRGDPASEAGDPWGDISEDEAVTAHRVVDDAVNRNEENQYLSHDETLALSRNDIPPDDLQSQTPSPEVRVRVSSKHLSLASPVLKAAVTDVYATRKEGSKNPPQLSLSEDEPASLLILLNLIHGRWREVPRELNLDELTEVSILVDKYDMRQTAEIVSDIWHQNLKASVPNIFDDNLLSLICVSWVFDWRAIWDKATITAQRKSEGLILETRLPIPQSALEAIDKSRQSTLQDIFHFLQVAIECFKENKICEYTCDAMTLGTLTIELNRMGILSFPERPYNGYSVEGVFDDLKKVKIPLSCSESSCSARYHRNFGYRGFEITVTKKIEALEREIIPIGLEWTIKKDGRGKEVRSLTVQKS